MNVTRFNYNYLAPQIKAAINRADFISLDLEMTGTTLDGTPTNTRFDSHSLRYLKHYTNIKKFLPLQIGICCVNLQRKEFLPFSFYLFPDYKSNFIFDSSSLNFLTSNSYDFNKTFYDGVFFSPLKNEVMSEVYGNSIEKSKGKGNKLVYDHIQRPETKLVSLKLCSIISEWIEQSKQKETDTDKINELSNDTDIIESSDNYRKLSHGITENIGEGSLEVNVSYVKKKFILDLIKNIRDYIPSEWLELNLNRNSQYQDILQIKLSSEEAFRSKFKSFNSAKKTKLLKSWLQYQNAYYLQKEDSLSKSWKKLLIETAVANVVSSNHSLKAQGLQELIHESNLEGFNEEKIQSLINSIYGEEASSHNDEDVSGLKVMLEDFHSIAENKENTKNSSSIVSSNFSELVDYISLSKKPIVLHNGLLDLSHMMDKFLGSFPVDYTHFIKEVKKKFPTIYDTKYIVENSLTLKHFFNGNSGLENISSMLLKEEVNSSNSISGNSDSKSKSSGLDGDKKVESLTRISLTSDIEKLRSFIMNTSKGNENSSRSIAQYMEENLVEFSNHDAGFDAYVTAKVFLFLYRNLFNNQLNFNDVSFKQIEEDLQAFKSKMQFSGSENLWNFSETSDIGLDNIFNNNIDSEVFILRGFSAENIPYNELKACLIQSLELNNIEIVTSYGNKNLFCVISDNKKIAELESKIDNTENKEISVEYLGRELKLLKYRDYLKEVESNIENL